MDEVAEGRLIDDLARVIARHDCTGRQFQKACDIAARAYFEADDLDDYVNGNELMQAMETAGEHLAEALKAEGP